MNFWDSLKQFINPQEDFASPLSDDPYGTILAGKEQAEKKVGSYRPQPAYGNQYGRLIPEGLSAEEAAIKEFFPEEYDLAKAIFTHESQLGKYKQNLEGLPYYGIAQIGLKEHWDKIPGNTEEEKIEFLMEPMNNLRIARIIYEEAGNSFTPWESYTTGKYKEFYGK